MRLVTPGVPLVLLAIAIALAPATAHAGWPHDPHQAFQVTQSYGNQRADAAVSDGAGGAVVVLEDSRNGNVDVYAQHVLSDGTTDPSFGPGGVAVCTAGGDQTGIHAVSDGAGGVFVCWLDHRGAVAKAYGTRLLADGTIAPGFPPDGLLLDTAGPNADDAPQMSPDGLGGAIVVYEYEATAADRDVYGARFDGAGDLLWSQPLVTAPSMQSAPVVSYEPGVLDLAWVEANTAIDVERCGLGNGSVFTTPAQFSNPAYVNSSPRIAPDGDGGSIVTWVAQSGGNMAPSAARYFGGVRYAFFDNISGFNAPNVYLGDLVYGGDYSDWLVWAQGGSPQTLYLQEITRSSGGSPIQIALDADAVTHLPVVAPDLLGGALAGYGDVTAEEEAYAQRELQNGFGSPAFWNTYNGEGVIASIGITTRTTDAIAPDGSGGAIVFGRDITWFPNRVYASRIDRWGTYDGAPSGVAVKDVAGDQGGSVRVSWNASYLDAPYNGQVQAYWLWRQVPVTAALARIARGTPVERAGDPSAPAPGTLRLTQAQGQTFAWEYVTSQVADGFSSYSLTTATTTDSVAGGNPETVFMVEARNNGYAIGWPSAPDSGYSVDNLAPAAPTPFTAAYSAGATNLHWGANAEPDFQDYRLYRGGSAGFTPGPSNLIATRTDTNYVDPGPAGSYYKLSAVDIHGNESAYSLVSPSGTTDAGAGGPIAFELSGATPNPAIGGRMRVAFVLPGDAPARLELLDVSGRRIAWCDVGALGAGRHAVDLAAARSPAPGLYFVRLTQGADRRVMRVSLID